MFTATHPFLFFDYFRVPYEVKETTDPTSLGLPVGIGTWGQVRCDGDGESARTLSWPLSTGTASDHGISGSFRLDGIPIFCHVVPDAILLGALRATGVSWSSVASVRDGQGAVVASVWRDSDGNIVLPFDPSESITSFWSESYQTESAMTPARRLKQAAMRSYYRVRPVLPRPAQIKMRQAFSYLQARSRFPKWPVETGLHDLYLMLFRFAADIARRPVPYLAEWPSKYRWSLVLTHDVETSVGVQNIHLLRDVELKSGFRSAWNFVGRRYEIDNKVIHDLADAGFEIGVHGLYHDGRDLESLAILNERLPLMRERAEQWQASGFRSPATHRVWEWMPLLGFDHDSSYPDSDPFEPQSGGCCSWLPYFNQNLVELPITLAQDHTLFVILRRRNEEVWASKADFLRNRGGMALLITHPDYMLEPHLVQAYSRFLESYKDDDTLWRALPRDVSEWWRRRADSRLEKVGDTWSIVGPAASDGRVALSAAG